nr:MAG TPA: hypothetical protein [Bacteriophage sp.]
MLKRVNTRQMIELYRDFRVIKLFKGIYLVSVASRRVYGNKPKIGLKNLIMYPLTFVFIPIRYE